MTGKQAHRISTTMLSLAMVAIGIALAFEALSSDSVLSARMLLGLLFVAAGSGRLYLELRRGRGT